PDLVGARGRTSIGPPSRSTASTHSQGSRRQQPIPASASSGFYSLAVTRGGGSSETSSEELQHSGAQTRRNRPSKRWPAAAPMTPAMGLEAQSSGRARNVHRRRARSPHSPGGTSGRLPRS